MSAVLVPTSLLAGFLLVAGCEGRPTLPATIPVADATRFIGHDLPVGATGVRVAGEAGADRLVLLRFDAAAPAVEAFARDLVGATVAGRDPGLGYLGERLDWWPATPPAGFAGGDARLPGNRTIKLLTAPGPDGRRTVYLAAFSS